MKVAPCFVDETGALHASAQSLFAIGCLIVREVPDLTDRLTTVSLNLNAKVRQQRLDLLRDIERNRKGNIQLRELHQLMANTRHHEYKFTELRKHNRSDYIALLDIFFSYPGSEFHCLIVERNQEALQYCGGDNWPVYVRVTSALLKRRLREPVFVCSDWQTRPRHQKLRLETELTRLEHVAGCLRMTSEMSTFLQVTDLLLGVASFDWRDARRQIGPSKNAQMKREVVDFVKSRMGMKPSDWFLPSGRRYFRKSVPIKFSVWQPNPAMLKVKRTQGMRGVSSRIGND
jgi:hypothetical protein